MIGSILNFEALLEAPLIKKQLVDLFNALRCANPINWNMSTVGNLHSFSDNGYFSPHKMVQSTYIFLKYSENYFGNF